MQFYSLVRDLPKAEKALQARHCLEYSHTDATVSVKDLFSRALAEGRHKQSHIDTAELQPALSPGLRPETTTGSNRAGEVVWLKEFNLSHYIVESIVLVCHMEKERGKKSPPNISIQFSVACSHKSASSETDLCLSKAAAYFCAGYHTVHRISKAQL